MKGASDLKPCILDLPNEILLQIFSYLDTDTIASSVQLVCKSWYSLSEDATLWTFISFKGNKSICKIPKVLPKYPYIRKINIEMGMLNSSTFKALSFLNHLQSISLMECYFFIGTKMSFGSLMKSSSLTNLSMIKCFMDDQILKIISEAENLKSLRLTSIDNEHLILVLKNCELTHLQIDKIDHISEEAIANIFKIRSDTLVSLILSGEKRLSDSAFVYMGNCSNLCDLSIDRCDNISDRILVQISKLTSVEHLSLKYGSIFTSVGLKKLFEGFNIANLVYLDLTRCPNFDDDCLAVVANHCQNINNLCLNYCVKLTDAGIHYVVKHCTRLRVLDVSWIESLKGAFFELLKEYLRDLNVLDIRACNKIERSLIKALEDSCLSLKVYK